MAAVLCYHDEVNEYDIIKNQSPSIDGIYRNIGVRSIEPGIDQPDIRVNQAYSNQKQFVENASHELQTPLAIIRSKLDLLINSEELTEDTANLLAAITEASERLSQMNKNLLLLTKIDNNQFPEQTEINISVTIENYFRIIRDIMMKICPL